MEIEKLEARFPIFFFFFLWFVAQISSYFFGANFSMAYSALSLFLEEESIFNTQKKSAREKLQQHVLT